MRRSLRRPSPALLIACLALFVALTGTSVAVSNALPKNSVGTAQLKNNAVVSSKVKDGSLKAADFAAGQLPAGQPGPKGDPGPQGPSDAYGVFRNGPVQTSTPMTTIAYLSLPPGKYAIFAKAYFSNTGAVGASMNCQLVAGADYDQNRFLLDVAPSAFIEAPAFEVLHEFSSAGEADLRCDDSGASVFANFMKIHAIKVANLTNAGQ
jgi:hypothetical protein